MRVVDVGFGTGLVAAQAIKIIGSADLLTGVDPSPAMMGASPLAKQVKLVEGKAERIPLPDACADAYVISFGIRNVTDVQAALVEARRVLKPGARFLCLAFSQPATEMLRKAYDAYSFKVIPEIGKLVTKDRDSYQYLVESIRRFPDQRTFVSMIEKAGFSRAGYTNFTGGVAALHHGWAF